MRQSRVRAASGAVRRTAGTSGRGADSAAVRRVGHTVGTAHSRRLAPPSFAALKPVRGLTGHVRAVSEPCQSREWSAPQARGNERSWRGQRGGSTCGAHGWDRSLPAAGAAFVRGFHEKAGPVKRVRKNLVPASAGLGAPGRSLPLPPIRRFSSASRPGPVKAERSEPPGPALTGGREATIRARRQWQALEACCHCFFFPRFSAGQPRAPCFHSHSPSASRRRGARWGPCC
jgi:hypothetical protein